MKSNYVMLKAAVLLFVFTMFTNVLPAQTVSVTDDDGYSPASSAMLDVKSTDKGMLIPRMTTAQRNAITSPAEGLFVYDTDEKIFYYYNGTEWVDMPTKNVASTDTSVTISKQLILEGDALVWDDLRVPVTSSSRGGSHDPSFSRFESNSSQGVFIYYFDKSTEEELYFTVQLPHSYVAGSDLHAHVHWVPKYAGGSGNVVWGIEYIWANVNDDFPSSTSFTTGTASVPSTIKHSICSLGTIDGTGKDFSSMLICRIYRDASNSSDTYSNDAGLLEIDFHYQKSTLGTTSEY